VEETIYLVDDEEQGDEVRTVRKQSEMLFLRGMHYVATDNSYCVQRESD